MAPLSLTPATDALLAVLSGFFFGFILEKSGFGDARNLAAQFYLHNMRVLKVMFTAIVTAMLLLFAASACGWVQFAQVNVPLTYLGPAVLGGLLLGVGFIVGGYCPGTSLVALATLKIDGLLFAGGVGLGLLLFGETAPGFWGFFHHAGAMGRITIFDLAGLDAGWVVLGVVVMAIGAFAFAELMERLFAAAPAPALSPRTRHMRRGAIAAAVGLAMVTLLVGQPTLARRMAAEEPRLSARLQSRAAHIDPAELLTLVYDNAAPVLLLDVRNESDFNRFHLRDARRVTLADLDAGKPADISPQAVVVVMSNDEQAADEAWKRLATRPGVNAYVLAGGVNRWLDLYREQRPDVAAADQPSHGDEQLRHAIPALLGDRDPAARPPFKAAATRKFAAKVQLLGPVRARSGGCG